MNITPVEGSLAGGAYTLVQSGSALVRGSASNSTYNAKVVDAQGNDITADMFQTVSVSHSGNNIVLNVSARRGTSTGPVTSTAWDVKTTNNWTGDGTQFGQLDKVTFGNVANKNVTVDIAVLPGSVTFDGGAGKHLHGHRLRRHDRHRAGERQLRHGAAPEHGQQLLAARPPSPAARGWR